MNNTNWSLHTKFLHLGLVITVTAQLLLSLVMSEPGHKNGILGHYAYEMHEVIGLTALAIVLIHWAWSMLSKQEGGIKRFFPIGAQGRALVVEDIKNIFRRNFSAINEKGLPSLIQGLGLLAVTAAAMSGFFIFLTLPETGKPGNVAKGFMEFHEEITTFVWIYWVGHGGAAMLHHFSGSDIVRRMFNFNSDDSTKNTVSQNPIHH